MLWQRDESTLVVTGSRTAVQRTVAQLVSANRGAGRVVLAWDFIAAVHAHLDPARKRQPPASWKSVMRAAEQAASRPVVLFARYSARSIFEALRSPDVLVILVDQRLQSAELQSAQ
jgi:hypothetical protein